MLAGAVIGPTATTDGNDTDSGYGYNAHVVGLDDEMRAVLYEGGWTQPQVVSNWNSYYRPDITRSINRNPNKWMVAFLFNDSRESGIRDIRISEKTFGQPGWTESSVGASLEIPQVAVGYDPISQRFLLATLTNSDEIQIRSRPFAGGAWSTDFVRNGGAGGPTVTAYDGADIACSAWLNADSHNCVATYVTASVASAIRYVPFHMSGGTVVSGAVTSSGGIVGVSRPSATANPSNADPKFQYSFSQGGTTIFTRLQNRNSVIWYSGTPVVAPQQWAPPAGIGSFVDGGGLHSDMAVAQ